MMNDDNTDAIYEFGEEVAVSSRESAIQNISDLLLGHRNDEMGRLLSKRIQEANLSKEQTDAVKMLAIDCIDSAIYGIFLNFQESMGKYKIVTNDKQGQPFDIVTESDGLPYGYLEFIDEFSQYNTADEFLETGKLEKVRNKSE